MTGSQRPAERRTGGPTGWFQIGVGIAGLGLLVILVTLYYWTLLLGPGDALGILWTIAAILLGVPAILAVIGAVALWRRRRWGFWVVVAELVIVLLTGIGETTAQTSSLFQGIAVFAGIVLAIVGFFQTKTPA